ncbi:MAG: Fe-S cluster assembly protein SufB, partial [Maricaulis sp.]
MAAIKQTIDDVRELESGKYKYGFTTDTEQDIAPKGLNTDIIRYISATKDEPQWMLDWRLAAYERWQEMDNPEWANVH